jgi:hypothetical protein
MKCITVQDRTLLEKLEFRGGQYDKNLSPYKLKGNYTVPDNAYCCENLIKPYKFMMKTYRYEHRPIFMCPVGHMVNFCGANPKDAYIIVMNVPDKSCKIQDFYCWTDFVYFTELPKDYKPFNGINTVEQFGRYILTQYKDGFGNNKDLVFQVTTQHINANWIEQALPMNDKFYNTYMYGDCRVLRWK